MVLTPAGLPPSAGAKLELTEIPHDLREEEGLHAALDALQALAVVADEVLSGIMVGKSTLFSCCGAMSCSTLPAKAMSISSLKCSMQELLFPHQHNPNT